MSESDKVSESDKESSLEPKHAIPYPSTAGESTQIEHVWLKLEELERRLANLEKVSVLYLGKGCTHTPVLYGKNPSELRVERSDTVGIKSYYECARCGCLYSTI